MVMPMSATVAGDPRDQRRLAFGPAVHHQVDADDAEPETEPLPRHHALAQQPVGERRGQDRLQAHHQRGKARRQPAVDRDEYAAEIAAMHEQAHDRAVQGAGGPRPARARDKRDDAEQRDHQRPCAP